MTTERIQRAVSAILNGTNEEADAAMSDLTRIEREEALELAGDDIRQQRAEVRHMEKWVARERAKGRPESELTWGNCVRETGILFRDGLRAQ